MSLQIPIMAVPATNNKSDGPRRRRGGRGKKHDWDDKRDICHQLFLEQDMSLKQIRQYFAERFEVEIKDVPSITGFRRQFRAWGFQKNKSPVSSGDMPTILSRIRELWEQNMPKKDIYQTLVDDGWHFGDQAFHRICINNGIRVRRGAGFKDKKTWSKKRKTNSQNVDVDDSLDDEEASTRDSDENENSGRPDSPEPLVRPLEPHEAAQRQQRLRDIEQWDAQKFQARKRRRRIRGFGHLPADAPGSVPRYASETSLDECKAYLNMTNEIYTTVRDEFEAICRESGIIKKTQCADGVWDASKRRLIAGNAHLTAAFNPTNPSYDKLDNALDCICTNVTKSMRIAGRLLTMAAASNILHLNPTESKTVRRSLYEILVADNFESKLICGKEKWQSLWQRWIATAEKLQRAVAEGDPQKMRAIECLSKSTLKRLGEDRARHGLRPNRLRNKGYGPGPGVARAKVKSQSTKAQRPTEATASHSANQPITQTGNGETRVATQVDQSPIRVEIREPRVRTAVLNRGYPPQPSGNLVASIADCTGDIDFNIDPALTSSSPFASETATQEHTSRPIPVYFRLASDSRLVGQFKKLWLGKLTSPTISSLREEAVKQNTNKATRLEVRKIHGVGKNGDGTEDLWLIESDEELEAYLEEVGEKPTFLVTLEGWSV